MFTVNACVWLCLNMCKDITILNSRKNNINSSSSINSTRKNKWIICLQGNKMICCTSKCTFESIKTYIKGDWETARRQRNWQQRETHFNISHKREYNEYIWLRIMDQIYTIRRLIYSYAFISIQKKQLHEAHIQVQEPYYNGTQHTRRDSQGSRSREALNTRRNKNDSIQQTS